MIFAKYFILIDIFFFISKVKLLKHINYINYFINLMNYKPLFYNLINKLE